MIELEPLMLRSLGLREPPGRFIVRFEGGQDSLRTALAYCLRRAYTLLWRGLAETENSKADGCDSVEH